MPPLKGRGGPPLGGGEVRPRRPRWGGGGGGAGGARGCGGAPAPRPWGGHGTAAFVGSRGNAPCASLK